MDLSVDLLELNVVKDLDANLEIDEKVSFLFLLPTDPEWTLRRLIEAIDRSEGDALKRTPDELLAEWIEQCNAQIENWKGTLVECLLIIKAYSELIRMNLNLRTLIHYYSPEDLERTRHVHRTKKILSALCNELSQHDREKMMDDILEDKNTILIVDKKNNSDYFEVFLLGLIAENIIAIGIWPLCPDPIERNPYCNLSCLTNKISDKYQIYIDALNSHETEVNLYLKKHDVKDTFNTFSDEYFDPDGENEHIDEIYKIINKSAVGTILIFNQKKFSGVCSDRKGTEYDVIELTNVWSMFGFKVIKYDDSNHDQIIMRISKKANNIKQLEDSAFAVCILSHGTNGEVCGSDGVSLKVNDIIKSMCTKNLEGKPKILLIQACREQKMPNENVDDDNIDDNNDASNDQTIVDNKDLLIFNSTLAKNLSYRNSKKGTWFIQALCFCLSKFGANQHLLDVFTYVNRKVAKMGNLDRNQMSEVKSTLTKKLQLFKIPYIPIHDKLRK